MDPQPNHRILVIDDNRAIHDDFRKILCPEGGSITDEEAAFYGDAPPTPLQPAFEIDSAFQGEEGVAMLTRAADEGRPYAMAFIDVRMPPGIDGIVIHPAMVYEPHGGVLLRFAKDARDSARGSKSRRSFPPRRSKPSLATGRKAMR